MTDKIKNILIGTFVMTAVVLVIGAILFFDPKIGDGKKMLLVRFSNISGINQGTRVTFAGKPVGELVSIKEIHDARETSVDDQGKVYFYLLTLKIDSKVHVYSSDEIAIRTTGLMGEKSIAILPKNPLPGQTAIAITDQVMTANSTDPLENTLHQFANASKRLDHSLAHVDEWFLNNQNHLSHTIQALNQFLDQGHALIANIDKSGIVPSLTSASHKLNDNLELFRSGLEDERIFQRISTLAETFTQVADSFNTDGALALQNIHQITQDIARGTGTIGKLINGEDLYLRMSSLMSKGETLMNDINHYGLLFQYDKQWQRSRTKRANQLKTLETAREFRTYFEGEVDNITTSLGRLTELLDYAGSERKKIVENEQFKLQFASLIRSVQSLSNSLKLYNEGLIYDSQEQ